MGTTETIAVWKLRPLAWSALVLIGLLTGYLFYDGLRLMVNMWVTQEEYGHGFLIPVIAAFLIWQKKDELELSRLEGAWSGILVVLLGIFLFFIGELSSLYIVIQYAFLIVLYGVAVTFVGWRGIRVIWAPLLFLVFMIPLPSFLYQGLSAQLQLISSEIGVAVIRLFGISVHLEGNVIDLGSYKLQVVEACSGLRYLFPLTSLAFLAAYIFRATFWKRAVVFLSSIPITIIMNSFRIGVIGVLVEYGGPAQAEGFLHDFEGWVVFMGCLSILVLEMWVLTRMGSNPKPLREAFGIELPESTPEDASIQLRDLSPPFFAAGVVLVGAAVLAASFGERSEIIPQRKVFADFPMNVGDWRGKPDRLEQIYLDVLKLDDYIIADYKGEGGQSVNFYTAYYTSQSKGESAHSPRSCLPGGGWKIEDLTKRTIDEIWIGDIPLSVNRVVIKKGDYKQLVYYWFQGRGRVITNEYMVKWFLLWDGVTKSRTDGALVRLTIMVPPELDLADADKALTAFTKNVSGLLESYIPQ